MYRHLPYALHRKDGTVPPLRACQVLSCRRPDNSVSRSCQHHGPHRRQPGRSMLGRFAPAPHVPPAALDRRYKPFTLARTSTRQVTGSLMFVCSILHVTLSSSRLLSGPSCRFHGSTRSRCSARSIIALGAPVPHVPGVVFVGSYKRFRGIPGAFVPARDAPSSGDGFSDVPPLLLGGRRFSFRPAERFARKPHLMHNHRQLASYRYLGLGHAASLGNP